MSKNDRVPYSPTSGPNFPSVDELAQIIADFHDGDMNLADVQPPSASDVALARVIRNRFYQGVYFTNLSDVHGLSLFGRRVIGTVLIGVVALILILTPWRAS